MSALTVPEGLTLAPQEERLFFALQEWASEAELRCAIRGKSPARVLISKLRRKLAPFGLTIECNRAQYDRSPRKWRILPPADQQERAA